MLILSSCGRRIIEIEPETYLPQTLSSRSFIKESEISLIDSISSLSIKEISPSLSIICFREATSLLYLAAIISTLFAVNKKVSILGFYGRYEGLITLISYYLIFLNVKEIKNRKYYKYLIYIFIFLGLFQTQNAFLQVFSDYKYIIRVIIDILFIPALR